MFKRRSFAVANALMVTLGLALFGSTVLLPQYLQVLMGYTAQQSGMALSPGGFLIIAMLPLVGVLVSKADTRVLVTMGFAVLSGSLFFMAHRMDLQMDFGTAVELRCIQSVGMAFLFVPIQTISYAGVEPQKFNQVSGIMNLSRNMGADVGIAFVTTLVTRRTQMHQVHLAAHTTGYDAQFQAALANSAASLQHAGSTAVEAARQATAVLYFQMQRQAAQLAYLDALWILGVAAALMIPIVWLTKRPAARGAPAGAH
jgi:DHA2 family multidrug resistance protein